MINRLAGALRRLTGSALAPIAGAGLIVAGVELIGGYLTQAHGALMADATRAGSLIRELAALGAQVQQLRGELDQADRPHLVDDGYPGPEDLDPLHAGDPT